MALVAGVNPVTGEPTGWTVEESTIQEATALVGLASAAYDEVRTASRQTRAAWLRAIADELEAAREGLVDSGLRETGLPEGRLNSELTRTVYQAGLFAEVLDDGGYLEATIDHAGDTPMGPRPDLRRMLVPVGPVVVFGASNFPFAFSVPGGDTVSALAAGCPVVVKAHPSHPETSVRAYDAMRTALSRGGAPEGTLSIVHGMEAGRALVTDPRVQAVGFTGSAAGGRALRALVDARPNPVPFYGELSGLNPLVVTASAAAADAAGVGRGIAASVTLGGGQFCTKPGLVLVPSGSDGDDLVDELRAALSETPPHPALNEAIARGYAQGRERRGSVSEAPESRAGFWLDPAIVEIGPEQVEGQMLEECFGPLVVCVRYGDQAQLQELLARLPGSLTASLHATPDEPVDAILSLLHERAGRIIWNGYPTGVAVAWGMQHGGPAPSTTNSLHTSVGPSSIRRFLRPLTWQNAPVQVLPVELRDDPCGIPRRVDGLLAVS